MKQLKDKPNQPSRPGLRVRWNYFFDRTIAGGTPILMLWLAAISAAVVAVAALLMTFGLHPTDEPMGFGEAYWNAMGAALDPAPAEDTGWAYRAVMLAVAIIGILIVSTIIGVLTSGIEGKLDNLRRGRSLVLEHNHTIILGWSSKIAAAVRELAIANESHKRAVIAILADRDKVEMEEHLLDHAPDLGTTEIICRRGDPCDLADLTIVRPELARSVILFNDEGENGDAHVLKRALALHRCTENTGHSCSVVAEVVDSENADAVSRVGNVQIVQPSHLITRILLQAARQPGLSLVYDELLSFEGCEIYFHQDDSLAGQTYGDVTLSFPRASVIGLVISNGSHQLNPPNDTVLGTSDQIIVVAEDDADIATPSATPMSFDLSSIRQPTAPTAVPEGYIVLGWHQWAPLLLKELNEHLVPGSSLNVVYDSDYTSGPEDELLQSLNNIKVTTQTAHTSRRVDLEKLDLGAIDEIVLLSYRDSLDRQSADSRTLLTLVHLREFVANSGRPIGIASELLDTRNRALANRGREDDFIASEELVSNVMVQLSENPHLSSVLDELLTAAGSEMYLRPVGQYIEPNTRIPFGAIVQAGLDRGDAVIGVLDRDPTKPLPDLRLSIDKNEEVLLGPEDAIVVVAKD